MRVLKIAALAGAFMVVQPAQGALVGGFELNGSLANSVANGVTLTNNGGTLSATGITFGFNGGPTISGLSALPNYTIDFGFTLDETTGYRRLIDFSNRASDRGYYNLNGRLNSFPLSSSANVVFTPGTPVRLTISRDATGLITAYIDGTQIYAQPDPTNATVTAIDGTNPLNFFIDDLAVPNEATSGFVDYIRIFDTAITPQEAEPGVPEPATWAMMLMGFGALGFGLRRRSAVTTRIRFV